MTSYLGVDPEPRPHLSSGHIPGSLSLPFNLFIKSHKVATDSPLSSYPPYLSDGYTTLLTPDELSDEIRKSLGSEYGNQILAGERRVVMTCGSGMTAAVLWLGLSSIWEAQQRTAPPLAIYDEVRLSQVKENILFFNSSSHPVVDWICSQTRKQDYQG